VITRIDGGLASPHGFLGRTGGVSAGVYASLNVGLGSGDDKALVAENRARAREALAPGAALVTLRQVHSAIVHVAHDWGDAARPEGDALVTNRPGLLLGILTADCAPVLLEDPAAGVVGAAHAGWKGALAGVLEATVDAMVRLGAGRSRICAAIGPCIARASYEVGPEFRDRFLAEHPVDARFFAEGSRGRPHFDLESYCAHRLAAAGVGQVHALGADTLADPQRFFSYRRATLAGEADYGRQLSAIAL
jgi:YfiH family protein